MYYDGSNGGGFECGSEVWGMISDYAASEDRTTAHSYNYLYVEENLDNLILPGGVRIGESKDQILGKLGLVGVRLNAKGIENGEKTCEISFRGNKLMYQDTYDWQRAVVAGHPSLPERSVSNLLMIPL